MEQLLEQGQVQEQLVRQQEQQQVQQRELRLGPLQAQALGLLQAQQERLQVQKLQIKNIFFVLIHQRAIDYRLSGGGGGGVKGLKKTL